MCAKAVKRQEAQNPLILRCHRIMDSFSKSDDERDFYIDRMEGFLIYVDLDKPQEELEALEDELRANSDRYCLIPKLSFYETKKIMEGFVNEKVYDIDTKEKLLDIIQSKEARENFLEFIHDHLSEQEKWQQYYVERSRIRIIEWLRQNHFHFVFEEDLDIPRQLLEKLKQNLFENKVGKDILNARKNLVAKAKTYYSNEALNPRPKRGRPPKLAVKAEIEPQITTDIFTSVPAKVRPFLFTPDVSSSGLSAFSAKFEGEERRGLGEEETLQQKLASLRSLSSRWLEAEEFSPKHGANDFKNIAEKGESKKGVEKKEKMAFKQKAKSAKPKKIAMKRTPIPKVKPESRKKMYKPLKKIKPKKPKEEF